MALEFLEQAGNCWSLVGQGSRFGNSLPGGKTAAHRQLLEKIVLRSAALMAESSNASSDHPFGMGLITAADALRWTDRARFSTLLERLKALHGGLPQGRTVLDYLERKMEESDRAWRKKQGGDFSCP